MEGREEKRQIRIVYDDARERKHVRDACCTRCLISSAHTKCSKSMHWSAKLGRQGHFSAAFRQWTMYLEDRDVRVPCP
jgi:hypothetical protein